MTVDGQVVALAIRELRAMPPKTGGLLVPFQRVAEAIMTVVGVDGARLTLAHEDHQPKWVATTDAAKAKGVLAATRGVTPDQGFQQLRARARSSSRKLADLAREVVQQAQRERVAALAIDDARVGAAEARAQDAEQTLQAARTGLAQRAAALDRAQDDADARERTADQRGHVSDERGRRPTPASRRPGRLAGDWGW
jgi:ANTAR domain